MKELEQNEWEIRLRHCPHCASKNIATMFAHGDSGSGFHKDCPASIGSWSSRYYRCPDCEKEFVVLSNGARKQRQALRRLLEAKK